MDILWLNGILQPTRKEIDEMFPEGPWGQCAFAAGLVQRSVAAWALRCEPITGFVVFSTDDEGILLDTLCHSKRNIDVSSLQVYNKRKRWAVFRPEGDSGYWRVTRENNAIKLIDANITSKFSHVTAAVTVSEAITCFDASLSQFKVGGSLLSSMMYYVSVDELERAQCEMQMIY